jgi:hypothetical protein
MPCPSGKVAFTTRRLARKNARRTHASQHLRPYLCDDCRCWHLGHLPRIVIQGLIGADALYAIRAQRQQHRHAS